MYIQTLYLLRVWVPSKSLFIWPYGLRQENALWTFDYIWLQKHFWIFVLALLCNILPSPSHTHTYLLCYLGYQTSGEFLHSLYRQLQAAQVVGPHGSVPSSQDMAVVQNWTDLAGLVSDHTATIISQLKRAQEKVFIIAWNAESLLWACKITTYYEQLVLTIIYIQVWKLVPVRRPMAGKCYVGLLETLSGVVKFIITSSHQYILWDLWVIGPVDKSVSFTLCATESWITCKCGYNCPGLCSHTNMCMYVVF